MSKLIIEMEMPTVCDECPMMYEGIFCAATGTEVYPNRQARILKNGREFDPCENRLDDCPIKGEISDIELMHLEEERAFAARNIAAESEADADYQLSVLMQEYFERYEPTYNSEDGSM